MTQMNRTVRHALAVVAVLAGLAATPVRAAGELELDGMYLSEGVNPDGSKYSGVVNITRNGDSFLVSWLAPQSQDGRVQLQPSSVGVGILNSDLLSVSYYAPKSSGIVVYRIEVEGHRLAGRWALAGDGGGVYSEILTKLPDSAAPPAIADPVEPRPAPVQRTPVHLPGTRSL
jgi:hypothetical protein